MCRPIRQPTEMKGHEMKNHALACFGGARPQHVCAIARSLGMKEVLIHRLCGILSAYGMGMADVVEEEREPYSAVYGPDSVLEASNREAVLLNCVKQKLQLQGFNLEWNNRGIFTFHDVLISIMSLSLVLWFRLFSDQNHSGGLIALRNSSISTFSHGLSVGYFIADLGMICCWYPSLGGSEYVFHHSLSAIAVAYAMYMGEGRLYPFMALISEVTTPWINFRCYLDISGLKKSSAYLINGAVIFLSWLTFDPRGRGSHQHGSILMYQGGGDDECSLEKKKGKREIGCFWKKSEKGRSCYYLKSA